MSDQSTPNELATRVIFAGQEPDPSTGALMTPIYANSTFIQQSPGVHKGMEYGRGDNPTRHAFERCVANLEAGNLNNAEAARGFAFASGLAAADVILDLLSPGDGVIAMDDLYGGTVRLFDQIRATTHQLHFNYIDLTDPDHLINAIDDNTKMLWIETPTNPLMKIADLESLITIAKDHGILVVVDNTFSSPILQRPLEFGADIVFHSVTKYLNGHSDMIGGVMVTHPDRADLADQFKFLQNAAGAILSPFDAFLAMRGVKTLAVRMERHCENARAIADYLDAHNRVEKVYYPGLTSHDGHHIATGQMDDFGGMISVDIKGGMNAARDFLERTEVFTLAESLGGVESLIEHPATMTHASVPEDTRLAIGITDGLIRLSVGIEDSDDLLADLNRALG
jgi:cystathionine gamma-lyase